MDDPWAILLGLGEPEGVGPARVHPVIRRIQSGPVVLAVEVEPPLRKPRVPAQLRRVEVTRGELGLRLHREVLPVLARA